MQEFFCPLKNELSVCDGLCNGCPERARNEIDLLNEKIAALCIERERIRIRIRNEKSFFLLNNVTLIKIQVKDIELTDKINELYIQKKRLLRRINRRSKNDKIT